VVNLILPNKVGFAGVLVSECPDVVGDFGAIVGTNRNAPCPCGKQGPDGKPVKYKNCHGKNLR